MSLRRQAWIILRLLRQHRLFDKQRAIRLQLFDQHFCHWRADAAVEIEAKFNLFTEGFTDLRHGIHRVIDFARVIDNAHLFAAVEFEGIKTDGAQFLDAINHIGRTIAAHPAVGFNAVTH